MTRIIFELVVQTLVAPEEIVVQLHEYMAVSAPITTWIWRTPQKDVTHYLCDFPLEVLEKNEEESEPPYIHVSAFEVPFFLQNYIGESFDLLGMTGEPQTYVEVDFQLKADFGYYVEGCLHVLRLMGVILGLIEGDCFARSEDSSYCQLIRKDGKIMIDTSYMSWSEAEKQAIDVPLTIAKIPVLT